MVMNKIESDHPEIMEQKIYEPIVICGLNRSGTTFLQNLLAQDPDQRTTMYVEMLMPYGHDGKYRRFGISNEEAWDQDLRIPHAQEVLDTQLGLSEEWMAIHAQTAASPEEDFMIMEQCARCYSICAEFCVPSYKEWLCANDCAEMKRAYKFHRRFLQHLQFQRPGKRWVFKMPFHLFALDALFAEYPGARIVFNHRDPTVTLGSWASLVNTVQSQMLLSSDPHRIGQEELKVMSSMMKSALAFRAQHPELEGQFFDVQFSDLIGDPIRIAKDVYKHYGIEFTDRTEENMKSFIEKERSNRDKSTKHTYKLSDGGLTEEAVKHEFSEYLSSSFYNSGHFKN